MNAKQIVSDLERTLEMLNAPEKWCQGRYRDEDAHCLYAALMDANAMPSTFHYVATCVPAPIVLRSVLCTCEQCTGRRPSFEQYSIIGFNDSPYTTYEDVILLLKSAIYALDER